MRRAAQGGGRLWRRSAPKIILGGDGLPPKNPGKTKNILILVVNSVKKHLFLVENGKNPALPLHPALAASQSGGLRGGGAGGVRPPP